MVRNTTPEKPRRRSYQTGESLPELTDSLRPIPLGYDRAGDPDEQIRAFAVSIRNRSDSPIYVAESPESDGARIDRFESYDIYETNGISRIFLRGENGGEAVTIRTLEAHNDFSITDKIEGFIRAISHFLRQSKTEAVITSAETTFDIAIQESNVNFDTSITDVNDEITFSTAIDSVADGVEFNTAIAGVADGVTFDTAISDIAGDVELNTSIAGISDGVTFDTNISGTDGDVDINIRNQDFDNLTTDINAQSIGDLNVLDRTGDERNRFLGAQDSFYDGDAITRTWSLYENADFDGRIERVAFRIAERGHEAPETIGWRLQVDRKDGNGWQSVSSREGRSMSRLNIVGSRSDNWYIQRFMKGIESSYGWEPNDPVTFSAGSDVRLQVEPDTGAFTGSDWQDSGEVSIDIEIMVTERIRET